MFKTLYGNLAAVLLGLFCVIGVLLILLSLYTTRMYVHEVNQKLNRSLAEHMVAEKILMPGGRVNEEALKEIFHMLMVINPSIEVYLLDADGADVTCTCRGFEYRGACTHARTLKASLAGGGALPVGVVPVV